MQSPDIEVAAGGRAKNILEALELGQIDLGILRAESIKSGQYKLYPLIRDEIAFMCTSKHPLANREMIGHAGSGGGENLHGAARLPPSTRPA
jgi:DNA-binding transcriptional LysR family regulator